MPESIPLKPDKDSKSQRKEDMLALQKIGESLVKLTEEQLAGMDLPADLLTAIQHSKSLTSNEAKRRQLQ
jgi:ribosome-associated protein